MNFRETLHNESQQLFWDVEWHALDLVRHRDFILGRVLSFGSETAVRAVVAELGASVVRDFLLRAPHRLDERSRRFFEVVFSIDRSSCTMKPSRPINEPLFQP